MDLNEELELTEEQKNQLLDLWNSGIQDLKPITVNLFGEGFDGRSKEARAIKSFLATRKLKARPSHIKILKTSGIELSEEQKEFIRNNAANIKPLDLVQELFNNYSLNNLSAEYRCVINFIDEEDIEALDYNKTSAKIIRTYRPPKTIEQAKARVNNYKLDAFPKDKPLTQYDKNGLEALIRFTHSNRFLREIESFQTDEEKTSFESSFILFTYNKPDLSEEEINLYINLCVDIVQEPNTRRQIAHLRNLLENTATDSEGQRVSKGLADAIHQAETELHQNRKRQSDLISNLQGKRSERLERNNSAFAALTNLVALWKEEEQRVQLLKYAELEKEILAKEVDRINDMDELRAKIMGISKEEILNGKM